MATIQYKINNATIEDVMLQLNKCNEHFEPSLDERVNIARYSEKIVSLSVTFEAWASETLVGLLAAYFNDEKKEKGYITNVSVVKEYQRNGIASHLMQSCVKYAKDNEFSEISLEVSRGNQRAIKLYEKFCFTKDREESGVIIMRCDTGSMNSKHTLN